MSEQIAEALAAHAGVSVTAGWEGSPDPSNWRNIRRVCKCGEVIERGPRPPDGVWHPLGGRPFDEPHRAHLAAVLSAAQGHEIKETR